ncbi:MAG: histidine kinase [Actinomycetota bacterium]
MSDRLTSDGDAAPGLLTWLRADLRRFDLVVATITIAVGGALIAGNTDRFDTGWPEVAAGVGAFGLLALRRHVTPVLLAIALFATVVHVALLDRPTPMIFAALVLLATLCVRLDRRPAILLGAATGALLYGLNLLFTDVAPGDPRAVITLAWTGLAVGVADATRSWRRYRESSEAQVRSAVLAAEAETRQQVSQERLAIARELHDLLAHNLSVMNVQTGAALHLLRADPEHAETALITARDAGRTILDELRELLAVLRDDDADGEPITSLPTVDDLDRLVDTMRAAGLAVTWTETGAPRNLAPAVSLASYRIVQEALTNAAKHGSGTADLRTTWVDDGLDVGVTNPIAGEAGVGGGHGVIGMRERAQANGGRLGVEVVDGQFVVEAWLPAAPEREVTA